MRFKSHIELKKGQLDIAPLIDVVFLLLIFFMLTSSFISHQGIKVNLPSAVTGRSLAQEEIVISITDEGKLTYNAEEVSIKELSDRLRIASKGKNNILIRADKEAPLGSVVEIWDLCRDVGITNINIATTQKR